MKCVGAAEPPCIRCVKGGRKCEFLQPGQTPPAQPRRKPKAQPQPIPAALDPTRDSHTRGQSHGPAVNSSRLGQQRAHLNHGSVSSSYNTPSWTPITPEPSTHGAAKKASELPSVYSASPLTTIVDGSLASNSHAKDHQQPPLKRRRTGGHVSEAGGSSQADISERDMEQLLQLYVCPSM